MSLNEHVVNWETRWISKRGREEFGEGERQSQYIHTLNFFIHSQSLSFTQHKAEWFLMNSREQTEIAPLMIVSAIIHNRHETGWMRQRCQRQLIRQHKINVSETCFPIKIKNKINYKQGVKDERLKVVKHSSNLFSYFSHSLMLC